MSNRENLKNFLTQNYLKGRTNVYKIKSPNGRHHVLVNRNSFAKLLLGRNNITTINQLVYKVRPYVARLKKTRRNEAISYTNSSNHNNYVPTSNYVFRAWNNTYGMRTVRGPYGTIKLTNVNHYKLSPANLRNLRGLRRQNVKNEEETIIKLANRLAKKTVQEIHGYNGLPPVWINSNGRRINAPSPSNLNLYMSQGGKKMYPHILKSANRALSTYIKATPNLRMHYRIMHIKK